MCIFADQAFAKTKGLIDAYSGFLNSVAGYVSNMGEASDPHLAVGKPNVNGNIIYP